MTDRIEQYLTSRREQLAWLEAMWLDPKVQCYNDAELPPDGSRSIFLNGPTSRRQILELNHRCRSVKYLRSAGYTEWIYVPELRGQEETYDFTEKDYVYNWESGRRLPATINSFWFPRDNNELLGLNSNLEFGIDIGRIISNMKGSKVFAGWPPDAQRMGLPNHYRELTMIPFFSDLKLMCEAMAAVLK